MRASSFSFAVLLLLSANLHADPRQWDTTGVVIRQGDDLEWNQVIARKEQGDVLVVWSGYANGDVDIYAQLVDREGIYQWAEGGVAVCGDPGVQKYPAAQAVEDGWIISWIDYRSPYNCIWSGSYCGDIRAQKLNNAGQRQWSMDGFTGVDVDGDIADLCIVPPRVMADHEGGAIIVWQGSSGNWDGAFAQRITGNGNLVWPQPVQLAPTYCASSDVATADDGNGNLLVAWRHDSDIVVNAISTEGEILWGAGVTVWSASFTTWVQVCPDGSGGAYVSWASLPAMWETDGAFVQRVSAIGQPVWTQPSQIEDTSFWGTPCLMLSVNQDTADGCIAAVTRNLNSQSEVWAQKVSPDGEVLWEPDGVILCSDADQFDGVLDLSLISDSAGGAVIAWSRKIDCGCATTFSEIRASRLNANGSLVWNGTCGVSVSPDTVHHHLPAMVAFDTSRVFIGWTDVHDGYSGIRGQIVEMSNGAQNILPAGITLRRGLNGTVERMNIISLATGRTAILWEDKRDWRANNNQARTFFKILDSLGSISGRADGDSLTSEESDPNITQTLMGSCQDAEGGFFTIFQDCRAGSLSLRAARINSAGESVGSPSGRIVWSINDYMDLDDAFCTSDSHGGMIVTWETNDTIRLARYDGTLSPLWPDAAVVTSDDRLKHPFGVVANSDGSCLVGWRSVLQYDSMVVHLAKCDPSGQVEWTTALSDTLICDLTSTSARIVADRSDGAYLCWTKWADGYGHFDLIAQHVTADSARLWGDRGMVVEQRVLGCVNPLEAVDAHENLVLLWQQQNANSSYAIAAAKLSPSGQLLWPNPVEVCISDSVFKSVNASDDGSDGLFTAWSSRASGHSVVYVMHLNAWGLPSADPFWAPSDGGMISASSESQSSPVVSTDGLGQVTVAWQQSSFSYGGNWACSIRSQRLVLEQTTPAKPRVCLPRQYALHPAFPNPFNPTSLIRFELAATGPVELKVFDVTGRLVSTLTDGIMSAGEHTVRFDGQALASGVYFYRLKAGSFTQTRKLVLIR